MATPRNLEEFLDQFYKAEKIDGYGSDVCSHIPCPFCAFPDFMLLYPAAGILDDRPSVDQVMSAEHRCKRCGRSGKSIITRTDSSISFEFVQTGGPDPPEWLTRAPRRV